MYDKVIDTIPVGIHPNGAVSERIPSDDRCAASYWKVYVTNQGSNTVSVIKTDNRSGRSKVIDTIPAYFDLVGD